ncbi:hypothetical protein GCM10028819_44020 [Spirosoma humi]
MKRLLLMSALLVGLTAFGAEAQTTNAGNRSKKGQPKSIRRSPDSNPVADSAAMMSATDDGASGQSGRPVVNPSVPVTKSDSPKNKGRNRKAKQGS